MENKDLEKRIQVLKDREAIRELLSNYCWTIDNGKYEDFLELFMDDVVCDFGDLGHFSNKVEWRNFIYEGIPSISSRMRHLIHNENAEIKGDEARGRSYFDFTGIHDEKSFVGGGHYEHQFVKVNGQWKFKEIKAVIYYLVPLSEGWARGKDYSGMVGLD